MGNIRSKLLAKDLFKDGVKIGEEIVQPIYVIRYINSETGFVQIPLYKNGRRFLKSLGKVVAQAFVENPNEYSQIRHIDGNPLHNNAENLEWCDDRTKFKKNNIIVMKKKNEYCPYCKMKRVTYLNDKEWFCKNCLKKGNKF